MKQNLKQIYNKYVRGKYLFRVLSKEYLPNLKRNGLNPLNNPFRQNRYQLIKFFNFVQKLNRKGININFQGLHGIKDSMHISKVMKRNLSRKYIDFSPNKEYNNYYLKMRGGSLVFVVSFYIKEIKKRKIKLSQSENSLLDRMQNWCKLKQKFGLIKIKIPRESGSLERARLNCMGGKYLQSPFGSFKHFEKVINKEGIEIYLPLLKENKNFYVRLIKPIPAKDITFQ